MLRRAMMRIQMSLMFVIAGVLAACSSPTREGDDFTVYRRRFGGPVVPILHVWFGEDPTRDMRPLRAGDAKFFTRRNDRDLLHVMILGTAPTPEVCQLIRNSIRLVGEARAQLWEITVLPPSTDRIDGISCPYGVSRF